MPRPTYEPHWADPLYKLRYGVGANEKHDLALSGTIPGSKGSMYLETDPNKVDDEERRAAAYLTGQKWPTIGPVMTEVANTIRFLDPASRRQIASDAAQQGAADARAGSNLVAQRQQQGLAPIASARDQEGFLRTPSPSIRSDGY